MVDISLYPHQKRQLEFINKKLPGRLPIAIESPTGSGKTYVIMSFLKDYLEKNKDKDFMIVVTTGFNKLVHQFSKDFEKFGIEPIIWMGKGLITDSVKYKEKYGLKDLPNLSANIQAFTDDPDLHLDKPFKFCSMDQKDLYMQAYNKIKSFGPKIIITNHTSYLLGLKFGLFNPNICIVDESHTFGMFYENFLKLEITSNEIKKIQDSLSDSGPTLSLFKKSIDKGLKLSPQLFSKIREKLVENNMDVELIYRLEEFSKTEKKLSNHIEVNRSGIFVINFYTTFEVNQESVSYILFSATQDRYTMNMFRVPKNRKYTETTYNSIDYSKSELLVIPSKGFENGVKYFLSKCRQNNKTRGLILSTTNKDINYLMSEKEIHGYKFTNNLKEFENSNESNLVLVGSRALFQGIDIKDLQFVGINSIPFPTYSQKFQDQAKYLELVGKINPWTGFTIPIVINDLTQTMGRLWRSSDDYGLIGIFDERLNKRFSNIKKLIEKTRPNIKINDSITYEEILEHNSKVYNTN